MAEKESYLEDDPFWYKDAVIYELHIKAFQDANADGLGDFQGLVQKLDYLEGLGISAIWLLPFYPSPLKDDGYDISDYFNVHHDYGNISDFKDFLREAHRRGIRVITELVLNHTSAAHRWFQRSRKAKPGSMWRDFYVWSDTPEKYKDARIIFKDFETSNWAWDPIAKAYYWHRFYSHQPDLNYNSPHVQKAMFNAVDFWLKMGVDGLRLDAVPYLFERETTNCENLSETYEFLKKLRSYIDARYKNRMLLAEANQWPEDAAAYFGAGDMCHMAFHFPLMPRMFMGTWMEDNFPILDIFDQTPSIPESTQWTLFLRNHDELTLEMVSDEERDYMYRVYAKDPVARINLGIRRRLAPLLGNNRRKIELMNFLLFSLPGTPVIYYGDEIGMGDNYYLGDRNGVRTPMQWSADRNAGFSRANPHKLYLPIIIDPEYHYEAINVDNQEGNQASLLWWMKRVITMRKRFKAFGRGSIEFVKSNNPKVLAFIRQYKDECILAVVNLSRFSQPAELDISKFAGYVPREVFSRNKFPIIKDHPYVLTLGFYDYYWFLLKKEEEGILVGKRESIPSFHLREEWRELFDGKLKEKFESDLISYIEGCRWFGGKARKIQHISIAETVPVDEETCQTELLFLEVRYTDGGPETYLLPVTFVTGEKVESIKKDNPQSVIAEVYMPQSQGILQDAVHVQEFRKILLAMIAKRKSIKGEHGRLLAYRGKFLNMFKGKALPLEKSQVLKGEQSNTSFFYENELFFKLYRRLDPGINPDTEIGRFLTEKANFPNAPRFAGSLEYRRPGYEPTVIGLLQSFVPNQGDTWKYSIDSLGRYFERVLSKRNEIQEIPKASPFILGPPQNIPLLQELIGGDYLERIYLLGKRTGELHIALSSTAEEPAFAPEPFTLLYQRSIFQAMQSTLKRAFVLLRENIKNLKDPLKDKANTILSSEKSILEHLKIIYKKKLSAMKIRIHGDYHLGQVLFTGNDFIIIDFEGEPATSLSERRLKRSPLSDVAGMIRSFHYAAYTSLFKSLSLKVEDIPGLEPWAELWYLYVSASFLNSYLKTTKDSLFIPKNPDELQILLRAYLLEKAIYELGYELNNRPDWIQIPMKGIESLLQF